MKPVLVETDLITEDDLIPVLLKRDQYRVEWYVNELTKEWNREAQKRRDKMIELVQKRTEAEISLRKKWWKESTGGGRYSGPSRDMKEIQKRLESRARSGLSKVTIDLTVLTIFLPMDMKLKGLEEWSMKLNHNFRRMKFLRFGYRVIPFILGFIIFLITDSLGPKTPSLFGLSGSWFALITAMIVIFGGEHFVQSKTSGVIRTKLWSLVEQLWDGIGRNRDLNNELDMLILKATRAG